MVIGCNAGCLASNICFDKPVSLTHQCESDITWVITDKPILELLIIAPAPVFVYQSPLYHFTNLS